MESTMLVAIIAICYVSFLFIVAWRAEHWFGCITKRFQQGIYALTLAVYCSSWSFLGAVGQSATDFWSYLPIFIAPIIIFCFCSRILKKLITVAKSHNITSIADFIAARYGKSRLLASTVTLIALFGAMPYIALQLKAIVMSFNLFSSSNFTAADNANIALIVTLTLAGFAILFGTRKLNATEHNPGIMLAVALESLVKLVVFLLVGCVIVFSVFNGFDDIWQQARQQDLVINPNLQLEQILPQILLGMAAFFCMPRQFHVMVVEANDEKVLTKSRWIFPIYLLLIAIFVGPLALAGKLLLAASTSSDSYMISLPLALDMEWLAIIAFLGALSAATGMVIVSVIAISVMITNEWLIPLLLRYSNSKRSDFSVFSKQLLHIRRLAIIIVLTFGYLSYLCFQSESTLYYLGILSFGAFAQLAPALLGGIYWQHGNRGGVLLGIGVGFFIWCYIIFQGISEYLSLVNVDFNVVYSIQPSVMEMLFALSANTVCYILGSLWFRANLTERIQASSFVLNSGQKRGKRNTNSVTQRELLMLASRFISPARAYASFEQFDPQSVKKEHEHKAASSALITHTEYLLAGVIGASSTTLMLNSVLQGRDLALDEVFNLVNEASSQVMLGQDMLRATIEHAHEGMSVVDNKLNLVAWNYRYAELYQYPPNFLKAGMPIADVIRFNANRGYCGEGDIEQHVKKRIQHMRNGTPHSSERQRNDGKVIKIQGNNMPDGGFVMTFTDITQYRQQQQVLQDVNAMLESRVAKRTQELTLLNQELIAAKVKEEQANASKSRFLAAVGHDLMQPLNAARLFTASLSQYPKLDQEARTTISHVDNSLKTAGELLMDLLDISKLDSGMVGVNRRDFSLNEILNQLAVEFEAMAEDYHIDFRIHPSDIIVNSDPALLRRILQNFLTNAYRYAKGGRVLLGCRNRGKEAEIQVLDTGCGIAEDKCVEIFQEFKRINNPETNQVNGLGLGLAIADRMSKVLSHPIKVNSILGKGSVFAIRVPLGNSTTKPVQATTSPMLHPLAGINVLCIDNDATILVGLESLLTRWQCHVICAKDLSDARIKLGLKGVSPDIILADYQLDGKQTGLDALDEIRERYGAHLPGILITANTKKSLVDETERRGYKFMAKMIKPAALRALMSSLIKK